MWKHYIRLEDEDPQTVDLWWKDIITFCLCHQSLLRPLYREARGHFRLNVSPGENGKVKVGLFGIVPAKNPKIAYGNRTG